MGLKLGLLPFWGVCRGDENTKDVVELMTESDVVWIMLQIGTNGVQCGEIESIEKS